VRNSHTSNDDDDDDNNNTAIQQYRAKKQSTILRQMGTLIRYSLQEGEAQLTKEYGNVDRQSKASKRGTRFTDLVEFSQEETSTAPVVQKESEEVGRHKYTYTYTWCSLTRSLTHSFVD